MTLSKKVILVLLIFVAIAAALIFGTKQSSSPAEKPAEIPVSSGQIQTPVSAPEFSPPLDDWSKRIVKKPFGLFVSPQNSPVSPERFSGYHTGIDFEIFPGEENKNVEIKAICEGTILFKNWVSGYGGAAVEHCRLKNEDIAVLYGHLKLSSIKIAAGGKLSKGEIVGVLGKGFSPETDGERKHLHLGVHKGKEINFLGYVQKPQELENWIDATKYFQ